jgi:hypothetical protein
MDPLHPWASNQLWHNQHIHQPPSQFAHQLSHAAAWEPQNQVAHFDVQQNQAYTQYALQQPQQYLTAPQPSPPPFSAYSSPLPLSTPFSSSQFASPRLNQPSPFSSAESPFSAASPFPSPTFSSPPPRNSPPHSLEQLRELTQQHQQRLSQLHQQAEQRQQRIAQHQQQLREQQQARDNAQQQSRAEAFAFDQQLSQMQAARAAAAAAPASAASPMLPMPIRRQLSAEAMAARRAKKQLRQANRVAQHQQVMAVAHRAAKKEKLHSLMHELEVCVDQARKHSLQQQIEQLIDDTTGSIQVGSSGASSGFVSGHEALHAATIATNQAASFAAAAAAAASPAAPAAPAAPVRDEMDVDAQHFQTDQQSSVVFQQYQCRSLQFGLPHPCETTEAGTLHGTPLPPARFPLQASLPPHIIRDGLLSSLQLEGVVRRLPQGPLSGSCRIELISVLVFYSWSSRCMRVSVTHSFWAMAVELASSWPMASCLL